MTFLGGVGFFIGPVIGAIVFTLLQTVLSLHTELWQLYVGILFVATVMFFPSGLTGLLAIHAGPLRNGKLASLIVPYLKTLLPGALGVLGLAGLLEILFHYRHASTGDDQMSLFGIGFSSHSFVPWLVCIAIAVIGIGIARHFAADLRDGWDEANTPGDAS